MQAQSSSSTQDNATRAFGTAIGNLFLAFFGILWIVVSLVIAGRNYPLLYAGLGCFFTALSLYSFHTIRQVRGTMVRPDAAEKKRYRRQFRIVNIVQWGLVFLAIYILVHMQLYYWITPAIIFIVGIHFLPLARLFHMPVYYVTGPVMAAWAIVYPILFTPGKGDWIGGLGTGAILWITSLCLCGQIFRLLGRIRTMGPTNTPVPNGAHA